MGSHWTEKTLALENIKAADQDLIIDNANPSPSLSVPRPNPGKGNRPFPEFGSMLGGKKRRAMAEILDALDPATSQQRRDFRYH